MIYWELFIGFLRVGCFSFGGAYSAIPLVRDVVLSHGWMTDETLTYMIAVGESTPGPIMVNLATYVGCSQAGILGALVATLAVTLPAFVIILLAATVLKKLLQNKYAQAVQQGLLPCVAGIILATGLYMTASSCLSPQPGVSVSLQAVLAAVRFGAKSLFGKNISPIALIGAAAVLGVAVYGV